MDFKKWTPNIKCSIWGNPVKVDKPKNCPEPGKHTRCDDDHGACPHFMGLETRHKKEAFWGDIFPGCCWKLIEQEDSK